MKFTSLNKKNHFDNLKKEEFCIASKGLKVFVKENGTTSSRLGISISSKHANAVNRNKFKRRTREAVRSLPCLLYTSPSPRDATTSRMPSSA